jgi:hypothetical protein
VADYSFVTEWRVPAPIDEVFAVIADSLRWPEWWRGLQRVEELEAGDAAGLGNVRRYTFRGRLPYNLTFDVRTMLIQPPHALDGIASGELTGEGRWRLAVDGDATVVRCEWEVRTTERWMNLLAPLARPVFAWNHDLVMRQGGEGLRRRLGV